MRAWVLGDNVDTDAIVPGRYMKFGIEEIAPHCLETLRPAFARTVRPGDVVVGGRNFGAGSSREQAPAALKHLGVAALVAESFAGLFYRNAINIGLPIVECPEAIDDAETGDILEVDTDEGVVINTRTGKSYDATQHSPYVQEIIRQGGLMQAVAARVKAQQAGA